MDWRRAGSPTYGRRRSAGGIYSAPASPAHPLVGPAGAAATTTASPVHPLAARSNSKARAAAAMAHAMSRAAGPRDDDADHAADSNGMRYDGGRSPLRGGAYGYGYGGRSPLHAAGGGGAKQDKYFGFALPKVGMVWTQLQ